jgi:hypothetical protein
MSKYAREYWYRSVQSYADRYARADIEGNYIVSSEERDGRVDGWDGYRLDLDRNSLDELQKKLDRAKDESRKFDNRVGFLTAAIRVREAWDADEAERQREADEKAKQEARATRIRKLAGELQNVFTHGTPEASGLYYQAGNFTLGPMAAGGGGGSSLSGSWERLARWIDQQYGDE